MEVVDDGLSFPQLFETPYAPRRAIRSRLTLLEMDGRKSVCLGSVPIYVYEKDDRAAKSACIAMLSYTKLASDVAIARAFGCHRNTVGRLARLLATQGLAAVMPAKRGLKGPHKVTPEVLSVIAEEHGRMDEAALARTVAARTGVRLSLSHLRRLVARERPVQAAFPIPVGEDDPPAEPQIDAPGAADKSEDDIGDEPSGPAIAEGDGDSIPESVSAEDPVRDSFEPPALPPRCAKGRYMGLALYFPAISALGVLDAARRSFSLPRSAVFGVRAVTLSLLFMTLLRKPTVESAKHLRRAEFGALIGVRRAPCVKTLRRKLGALVAQERAGEFGNHLAREWVGAGVVAPGYLYVDGHMKVYAGKRRLAEFYNSQRRVALPGVLTYFVGDQAGRPLLVLGGELPGNLAHAMPEIVAAIRDVLGKRRFTLVFDRGGFDGKLFRWLDEQRIGFITYQRGAPNLPDNAFSRQQTTFEGRRLRLELAEDRAWVNGRGPWRRVVVRAEDGHQLPILSNLGLRATRVAALMSVRWRQENLFKYMGSHFGLDQLVSYGVDAAEPETLIPNPARRLLARQISELRQRAARLRSSLGDAVLEKDRGRSVRGLRVAQRGAVGRLRALNTEIARLVSARKALPEKVTVAESGSDRELLRGENKAIVDRIKISAYNAEEWLLERLEHHYPNANDVRDLLRSFAELSGELRATADGVAVTLDAPDTPLHRRALQGLVDELNTATTTYPGTDIPVSYRVRRRRISSDVHQGRPAA